MTTTIRDIAQEVVLGKTEGLSRRSVANLDNVHVIPKSIIGARIGNLAPHREREVKRALGHALAWPRLYTAP